MKRLNIRKQIEDWANTHMTQVASIPYPIWIKDWLLAEPPYCIQLRLFANVIGAEVFIIRPVGQDKSTWNFVSIGQADSVEQIALLYQLFSEKAELSAVVFSETKEERG